MTLQYHGDACVRITGKNGPQEFTVLCDPYDAKRTGLRPLRPSSVDLVCSTTGDLPQFSEGPFVVRGPGEYEVKGVSVLGIAVGGRTIYRIVAEDLAIAHCGNLAVKLDDAALDRLGDVDVLLVPVGGKSGGAGSAAGGGVLSTKDAATVVEQVEPRIVIPIQYAVTGTKLPYDAPAPFCKAMGCSEKDAEEKLRLTKKDLPSDAVLVRMLAVS